MHECIAENICAIPVNCKIVESATFRQNGLCVFPPAAAQAAAVIITDMRGRVVRRMTLRPQADNRFSMATTALPKGVYTARVADARGSVRLSVRFSVMR